MSKQCCILCGKKISSDQKCTIIVEEKKAVCLECMLTDLGVSNDEQTKGIENE